MDSVSKNDSSPRPPGWHEQLSGILHLTTIDGAFDETRDVALAPHCFVGREQVFPKWRELPFPEPFPDDIALETADENIRGLVYHLLPGLVDQLNAYHGTSYSIDFWRIVVSPWLIELVQKSWISFARLRMIIDQSGERPLMVKTFKGDADWHFKETVHFLETLIKDYRFNWWIDSEIIAAQAPDNWQLLPSEPVPHPEAEAATEPPRTQSSSRVRGILRNFKYWLGYSDILGIRWSGLLLSVFVNLLPKSPSKMRFIHNPDFHPESHFPRPFLDVLNRLIDATMPDSFLDGFPKLAEYARRLPYVPGRLRLGQLSFWNEQEKVIAAFAKEAGEKRVVFQHGGEYGMVKYNILANEMEFRSTIFVSWGWSYEEPGGSHILPLPSPFHSKVADRHKRQNDSIIVLGASIRTLMSRIHWWYRSATPVRYYMDTIGFLKNLNDGVRGSVVFRPYTRTACDFDTRQIIKDHFPEMPMLENDFHGAIMKCRLVVFYSFSTAMNHTMAANVPTVVYMAPDLMRPRKEAEPYFEPLRQCGILHDSPEAAAKHINHIYDDIEGWWQSPDVQTARKIWTHQYARTDRFWWWTWMKAFAQLKDVG